MFNVRSLYDAASILSRYAKLDAAFANTSLTIKPVWKMRWTRSEISLCYTYKSEMASFSNRSRFKSYYRKYIMKKYLKNN